MERIESLIQQLRDQWASRASPSEMIGTLRQIERELSGQADPVAHNLGTAKIAVVLPAGPLSFTGAVPAEMTVAEDLPQPVPAPARVQQEKEILHLVEEPLPSLKKSGQIDIVFDPMQDVPTLAQQETTRKAVPEKEVNELAGESESLNDRLKKGSTELGEVLKEAPIRDLRKAIGINDRYLFINELFRGDENMYERCIKTINNFNIYPEAEYWINRELKVKLGWVNDNPTVQHFDQLVKRRFS